MTVKDLIEELEARNPDEEIIVWDAMQDCAVAEVHLSEIAEGLLIASIEI